MTTPSARVAPRYDGGSIVNLVASLAAHFGVNTGHAAFSGPLSLDGADTVVLLVVDALGDAQLDRHVAEGVVPNLARLLSSGAATRHLATSTFPSTTMTAITSVHTGLAPAEHGWLGTSVWVPERAAVVDLIKTRDNITDRPLDDPAFLALAPSLYERLSAAGTRCFTVHPRAYRGTFLNDWYFRGAEYLGYLTPATIASIAATAAATGAPPRYVAAYWPGYDAVGHQHGPSSDHARDEIAAVDTAIGRLLARLPRTGRTALVITADHGQVDLDPAQAVWLNDVPGLSACLAGHPAGDRNARTLRVRDGALPDVTAMLAPFADVVPSRELWDAGWFGAPPARPEFLDRTLDAVAVPRDGAQLLWRYPAGEATRVLRGGHSGWSAAEMLVPVIAARV